MVMDGSLITIVKSGIDIYNLKKEKKRKKVKLLLFTITFHPKYNAPNFLILHYHAILRDLIQCLLC